MMRRLRNRWARRAPLRYYVRILLGRREQMRAELAEKFEKEAS